MTISTITHHPTPSAAIAAAVLAVVLGGAAVSLSHDWGGAVVPTDPVRSQVAPQHGGHYEYQSGGGKLVGGP